MIRRIIGRFLVGIFQPCRRTTAETTQRHAGHRYRRVQGRQRWRDDRTLFSETFDHPDVAGCDFDADRKVAAVRRRRTPDGVASLILP